jgi:hypothetical protein
VYATEHGRISCIADSLQPAFKVNVSAAVSYCEKYLVTVVSYFSKIVISYFITLLVSFRKQQVTLVTLPTQRIPELPGNGGKLVLTKFVCNPAGKIDNRHGSDE